MRQLPFFYYQILNTWMPLKNTWRFLLLFTLLQLACPPLANAQQKEVRHARQVWGGYMTTARISERFSIWNDFHYIPGGFGVARTGLTTHLPHRIDVTAGYARVWLPVAGELRRPEHRPWAQVVLPTPLGGNFNLQHRIRWDLRYRQRVAGIELQDSYTFNHRGRIQAVLRKNFPSLAFQGMVPSLVVADELLMNIGKEVGVNSFDQNRISLMAGLRHRGLLLQAGYMNRYVQSPIAGRYTSNHTLVVWLFHNMDLRKKAMSPEEQL
jgi:hypothetical protein